MGKFVTKKSLKIGLPVLVLAVIGVIIFVIFRNMNGPAEGMVAQAPPTSEDTNNSPAKPGKYDGKYISLSFPAYYKITPSQKNGGYLEVVNLSNTNHSGKYVSIGVLRESLQNDSGYNHRITYPGIYKQVSASANSAVFTSTQNGSEQTGFFAHGGLVVSISLTANGNITLAADYNAIAESLQWKQ